MKSKVFKFNRKLICVLLITAAVILSGFCVFGFSAPKTADAGAANSTVTIDLNKGMRSKGGPKFGVTGVEYSSASIVGTVNGAGTSITFDHTDTARTATTVNLVDEKLVFSHANVWAMFDDTAPYRKWDGSAYVGSGMIDDNYKNFDGPLLRGLFSLGGGDSSAAARLEADGTIEYDASKGDILYLSGDELVITENTTLYCYYNNNELTYATPDANDCPLNSSNQRVRMKGVSLQKGWNTAKTKDEDPIKERYYTPRDLQLFFHQLVSLNSDAFRNNGTNPRPDNYVKGVELPATVIKARGSAFHGQSSLEYVTGLESLVKAEGTSLFFGTFSNSIFSGTNPLILELTGEWASNIPSYGLSLNSKNSRVIFNTYASSLSGGALNNANIFQNTGNSATDPGTYVYVPFGKTDSWYPSNHAKSYMSLDSGARTIPMREYYQVSFNLNGAGAGAKVNGKSLYANQYQDARAVSVTKGADSERNISEDGTSTTYTTLDSVTTTVSKNPAAQQLSLLNLKKPVDPVKPGYRFLGWYYQTAGGMVKFDDKYWGTASGASIAAIVDANGKLNLEAAWEADNTVRYYTNGGVMTETADLTKSAWGNYYIEEYNAATSDYTLIEPSRDGYTFAGWFTDDGLTEANEITKILTGATGLQEVYAAWDIITYTISYDLNGGDEALGDNPEDYNAETVLTDLYGAINTSGGAFLGWFDEDDNLVTEIGGGMTGDLVLTAKWGEVLTITYNNILSSDTNDNPATYNEMLEITLNNAVRRGYIFEGWYEEGIFTTPVTKIEKGGSQNLELYAKWTLDEYTVSYVKNGGDGTDNDETYTILSDITLNGLTKRGYDFDGWFDASQNKITALGGDIIGDLVLTAKFTAIVYEITYDITVAGNPLSYTVESAIKNLSNAAKAGYAFAGWYNEAGDKISAIGGGEIGNIDLTARFNTIQYTITYDETIPGNPSGYNVESSTINLLGSEKEGYIFVWYNNSSYLGVPMTEIVTGTTGNLILYGKFIPKTYTITYNETAAGNPSSYTIESAPITLQVPMKDHYTFAGWYTDSSFTGSPVQYILRGSTGNLNLFAKFIPAEYYISYNLNGGTENPNPASYNVESGKITLAKPVKKGYTFAGWYGDASFSGSQITEIPAGMTGEIDLYAKWTKSKKGCGTAFDVTGSSGLFTGIVLLISGFAACFMIVRKKPKAGVGLEG